MSINSEGGTVTLDTVYQPQQVEGKWYQHWMEKGYFRAEVDPAKQPYCIVIPPPNVTGSLHLGHALNNTLQDILVRWKRMQGYAALWLPRYRPTRASLPRPGWKNSLLRKG